MDAPCGLVDWTSVPAWNPHPGVRAQRLDSDTLTIIRYELSAGARYPLHTHDAEQFAYGLSGEAAFAVGPEWIPLGMGDLIRVPARTRHGAAARGHRVAFLSISPRRA